MIHSPKTNPNAPGRGLQRLHTALGVLVWLVPLLGIAWVVMQDPGKRTVTPLYHEAVLDWWSQSSLYTGPLGFNYLPHFALVFTPFAWLSVPWGDVLWRTLAGAWLGAGVWQMAGMIDPRRRGTAFFLGSLLTIGLCLQALRNGQANALFAAVTFQSVLFLAQRKLLPCTVCLLLAVAIKPLGLVLLLLAPLIEPRLIRRLLYGLPLLVLLPFALGPTWYVQSQYQAAWANLRSCAAVTEHRFADLNGIFREFATPLSRTTMNVLSLATALAAAAFVLLVVRRLAPPLRHAALLAIATSYLMLFNPMNELNSYIILAPALSMVAVTLLQDMRSRAGWAVVGLILCLAILPETLRPVARTLGLWLPPMLTVVFVGLVVIVTAGKTCNVSRSDGASGC